MGCGVAWPRCGDLNKVLMLRKTKGRVRKVYFSLSSLPAPSGFDSVSRSASVLRNSSRGYLSSENLPAASRQPVRNTQEIERQSKREVASESLREQRLVGGQGACKSEGWGEVCGGLGGERDNSRLVGSEPHGNMP
eukprot:3933075-Rhodomonas_salina.1